MTHFYNPPRKPQEISRKHILTINEPNDLELALESPDFRQVRLLKMKNSNITDETTKCLLKVGFELQIEKIDISENFSFVTDDTLVTLAQCKALHRLGSINLADNNITDEGIKVMCDSSVFSKLRELVLYGNSGITNESMMALAASEWIKGVEQLDLHATFVGDVGIGTLLETDNSSCLEVLDVSMSWDRITDLTL